MSRSDLCTLTAVNDLASELLAHYPSVLHLTLGENEK